MAVYTHVDEDALADFLAHYDVGDVVAFKGIAEGVENSNFLLQTERGSYILTLYEKRVNRDELPFFLGLMGHLANKGLACPTPITGDDGKALRELCGRPAALISFLRGLSVVRPSPAHCASVGRGMAEMHMAVADFGMSRNNGLGLAGWRQLANACRDQAEQVRPGLMSMIDDELAWLDTAWPKVLPSGVIHADLFPDNVFFIGEQLTGLIDFYFACNDFLAYDLAIAMNAWCFESDRSFNATKTRRLLAGYQSVRPLEPAEIDALPALARGAALRFLLTRLYDWVNQVEGALVRPKDPSEYVEKLLFHRRVKNPGEYGL
ncbi:homoserine kinase [Emcibacter sp. SYSU 3D8]|uniref:homoserine kinase n=1 Tax=Emcibacter sp. SYSU 3D8 TaxID=3133969 RepID=UPI0031FEE892